MGKYYEPEFKLMIVNLLKSGQSVKDVSSDYSLDQSMIRRWRREEASDNLAFTGKGNKSLTEEQMEILKLREELKELKLERDILKKAVSIFSRKDS